MTEYDFALLVVGVCALVFGYYKIGQITERRKRKTKLD